MSLAATLQSTRCKKITLEKPSTDLRALGITLQQSVQLLQARLLNIKSAELKLEARRALERASYMFKTVSDTVTVVDRLKGVLESDFGLDLNDIFSMAGESEYMARVTTRSAMVMLNRGIEAAIQDLAKINRKIDKESKHDS